ncbi:Spore germination protein GerPC [Marininema mesophilum]|uniref:Spore germination protein GerPC n=1 Tax=Marininema mesophilum TaxID=1048340 RepID=A0A1H2WN01_9BACL|nr:spore germination protein GerPC [Marininema mesophilum]SDW81897.1 Spore germination protein GerPC [Marininema mesophilum]
MYAYLWDRINQLQQEMDALRQENEEIRKKLDAIEPLRIENMDYKVQELHVQTLSGALNIGLTLTGDDESMLKMVERLREKTDSNIDLGWNNTGVKPPWDEDDTIPITEESPADKNSTDRKKEEGED